MSALGQTGHIADILKSTRMTQPATMQM